MNQIEMYQNKRIAFYNQHPDFFSDFENPALEYALYDVMKLPKETIDEISLATEGLWHIFTKVSKQFKQLTKEQLLLLGIREEMIPYLHLDYLPQQSVLSRFDFICTEQGEIKAIELNADTPFLITETFKMNEHLCNEFKLQNPNNLQILVKSLSQAILSAARYLNTSSNEPVHLVITGKDYEEDWEEYAHIQFLQEVLPFEMEYVPISDLIIFSEDTEDVQRGLYTPSMKRIDVLYRPAHPIEFLLDDVAEDGTRIGLDLLELVKDRKLAIINSPAAYILQSKILLWLIWERRADPLLFTLEEQQFIERYMLPTYLSPDYFTEQHLPYVQKPIFSREGNTVTIYDSHNQEISSSTYNHYLDNLYLYQQYVEMPQRTVQLREGVTEKHWLIGSFVADDRACGLACRVGGLITEWDSHWLAIGYE